jgi:hypothetical protein
MTVIDLPRTQSEPTPESVGLAQLREMLIDPDWADCIDDIRKAIDYLTATTVLGA